jgi:hypothetical protein
MVNGRDDLYHAAGLFLPWTIEIEPGNGKAGILAVEVRNCPVYADQDQPASGKVFQPGDRKSGGTLIFTNSRH